MQTAVTTSALPDPAATAAPSQNPARADPLAGFAARLLGALRGNAEPSMQESPAEPNAKSPEPAISSDAATVLPAAGPDSSMLPAPVTPSSPALSPEPAALPQTAVDANPAPPAGKESATPTGRTNGGRIAHPVHVTSAADGTNAVDSPNMPPLPPWPPLQTPPVVAFPAHANLPSPTSVGASLTASTSEPRADESGPLPRHTEQAQPAADRAALPLSASPSAASIGTSKDLPLSPIPSGEKTQPATTPTALPLVLPQVAPPTSRAQPAPSGSSAGPPVPAPPFTPAAQIEAAIIAISKAADGARSMALQLHPAELGRVEIRIEQGNNTQATVHVTAERPETLELLMRDQPQLQHVLDQAGIAPDGRNLTFHLASQMQETPRPSTSGSATGFTATAGNPGQSGGTADAGSGGAGFQGSGSRGNGSQHRASSRAAVSRASLRWMRAGINITA